MACGQASKDAGRPVVYEFPHELLLEAGARHQVPPFAVIASNTVDLSVGRYCTSAPAHPPELGDFATA